MNEFGFCPPPSVLLSLKTVSFVLKSETRRYERLARTIKVTAQRRQILVPTPRVLNVEWRRGNEGPLFTGSSQQPVEPDS